MKVKEYMMKYIINKKKRFYILVALLCICSLSLGAKTEASSIYPGIFCNSDTANVQPVCKIIKTQIDNGLEYINYKYESLFGGAQNISVIEADTRYYTFGIADFGGRRKTSEMGVELGAVAAVNGSFFDKAGGSVTYFQIDGKMLDTTEIGRIYNLLDGAVKVKNGKLKIIDWNPMVERRYRNKSERSAVSGNYSKGQRGTSVLVAPPILVKNGKKTNPSMVQGLSTKQHPRTVVYMKKGKVGFMVIDGRSKDNAIGMTMEQMQEFLLNVLKVETAINLDGGGSSTLWVKGNDAKGVILNMPCDNGKFDNNGERAVGNGLFIFKKKR